MVAYMYYKQDHRIKASQVCKTVVMLGKALSRSEQDWPDWTKTMVKSCMHFDRRSEIFSDMSGRGREI